MTHPIANLARRAGIALGLRRASLAAARAMWPPATPHVEQITVNGCRLLVLANEDVGRRLAVLRRYEPWDTALLARLVRPGDTCVDAGANTGYYTMLLASRARHGAVHAFEPSELNWHLLAAGALLNGFRHVRTSRCALADHDGELEFSLAVDGAYSSIVPVGRRDEAARIRVPVARLDSAVERVDVLKLDVEGAEPLVLQGAARIFAHAARAPRVAMIELFERNLAAYGASIDQVLEQMSGYGYGAWYADERGRAQPFGREHHDRHQNVFFARSRDDLA